MKHFIIKKSVQQLVSNTFIFLFVYTALAKIFDYSTFEKILRDSPVREISWVIAPAIPAVLLVVSALLLYRPTLLIGLYFAGVCMVVFTIYTAWILLRAAPVPCSCGGVSRHLSWRQQFLFNLFFTILAVAAIFSRPSPKDRLITSSVSLKH